MNCFSVLTAAVLMTLAGVASAESATYKIDPTHTNATFETRHFGTSTNRGRWDKTEGEVTLDMVAKTGKADIRIDMASINTGTAPFNNHLKNADFFDVGNHPSATFAGDQFKFDGDKLTEVSGTLTLRGKTQPATLKAVNFNCYQHPMLKREVCGGDFETIVKRSEFGINWGLANKAAADDIKVVIQVEAVKQ